MRGLWIGFGIGSGMLWALNNAVFSAAYRQLFSGFGTGADDAILPAMIGAAYNDAMAFAVIAAYVACRRIRGAGISLFAVEYLPGMLCTGLLGGFLGSYCYFSAIALLGAQKALVFTSLYPVVSVLLARLFLQQRMTICMWTGCLLSLVGIWVMYGGTSLLDAMEVSFGVLLALGAAFCWGAEMVLASYTMRGLDATAAVLWREGISAAALWCAVLLWSVDASHGYPDALHTDVLALFFAGGAFAGLSYAFWYRANHHMGVAKGMALNTSYILWGTLLALLSGEEAHLAYAEWMGALVLFTGIVLVVWEPKRLRRFFGREKSLAYRDDSP